mgnify:CR=1 FL=1
MERKKHKGDSNFKYKKEKKKKRKIERTIWGSFKFPVENLIVSLPPPLSGWFSFLFSMLKISFSLPLPIFCVVFSFASLPPFPFSLIFSIFLFIFFINSGRPWSSRIPKASSGPSEPENHSFTFMNLRSNRNKATIQACNNWMSTLLDSDGSQWLSS